MPLSIFDAARYILEHSQWTITQLELQKLLYLGQMTHFGVHESPLLRARFEACKYGPVNIALRDALRQYGVEPLWPGCIGGNASTVKKGSTHKSVLDYVLKELSGKSGAELNAITHWTKGAWYQTFQAYDWNIEIPEPLMRKEYLERLAMAETTLANP